MSTHQHSAAASTAVVLGPAAALDASVNFIRLTNSNKMPQPPSATSRHRQSFNWCWLPFGCCCFICSCVSCFLLLLIALSDIALLVVSIFCYRRFLHFWTILDSKTTAVPVLFIAVASVRLLLSWCSRTKSKHIEVGVEAGSETDCRKDSGSEKKSKPVWIRIINFLCWGLFIAQLVGGIMALENRRNSNQLTYAMEHEFNASRSDSAAFQVIAKLQMAEECCGISSAEDYTFYLWPTELRQQNCCQIPPCFQKEFHEGCNFVVVQAVYYYNTWLAVVGIGVPVVALLIPVTLFVVVGCGMGCIVAGEQDVRGWETCYAISAPLIDDLFGIEVYPSPKSQRSQSAEARDSQEEIHLGEVLVKTETEPKSK